MMNHSSSSLRVAHLVNRLHHGVAARDLTNALNTYTEVESSLVSLEKSSECIEKVHVIHPQDDRSYSNVSISRVRWLRRKLSKFDVVTVYHTLSGLLSSIIGTLQGMGIVAREGNNHQKFSSKVRGVRTMTGLLADRVICVSQSVADSYRGFERIVPRRKIGVITNGVDIDAVQAAKQNQWSIYSTANVDPNASVVGTAGMLIEQKNHETLIRTIARLRDHRSLNVELVIAGSGPRREFLEDLSRDIGVQDAVHFLGYLKRNTVYKMLHEIDYYAMPSRWEGFSAAVLQAMAAGAPCILSDIPSFRSQYPEDVAVFHPTESVDGLVDALFEVFQSNDSFGERGFTFVSNNHSIEQMAQEYEAVYDDLVGK